VEDATPQRPGGNFRKLVFAAPAWTLAADGSWYTTDDGHFSLQTTLDLRSEGMPPDLRAALPTDLTDMLDELQFAAGGPMHVSNASVSLVFPPGEAPDDAAIGIRAKGRVTLADASVDLGVGIKDIGATMDYTFDRLAGPDGRYAGAPIVELKILADRFTAIGARATDGRVRVSGGSDGALYIPLISASCHGGTIAGTAMIFAPPIGADGKPGAREFQTDLRFSEIRFTPLVADFKSTVPAGAATTESPGAPAAPAGGLPEENAGDSGGRLEGQISLGGIIGDNDSRRGRGRAIVSGVQIVKMPIVVPLVRLTNLELPMAERLNFARSDFFIIGNRLQVENLKLSSRSVDLFGFGTATLPDLQLDLRFHAKNKTQIPLFSRIVEKIRNELVTAEVRGTLTNPDVKLITFAGTTRLIDRVFGTEPSDRERKLLEIQKDAERLSRENARRGPEGASEPGVKPE